MGRGSPGGMRGEYFLLCEQNGRQNAQGGMNHHGRDKGYEKQLSRKHQKERESRCAVIGPSRPFRTNKGLGVAEIHGGVTFEP